MIDLSKLQRKFDNIIHFIEHDAIPLAQGVVIGEIEVRTQASKDFNGRAFKPYTPQYKAWKQKHGLSTKPDLRVTGDMLGSLQRKGSQVTVSDSQKKKAEYVSEVRPFIGTNDKDKKKIGNAIVERMRQL